MWMLRCRARFIFFPLPFHKFRHCYFALHLFLCVATFTLHLKGGSVWPVSVRARSNFISPLTYFNFDFSYHCSTFPRQLSATLYQSINLQHIGFRPRNAIHFGSKLTPVGGKLKISSSDQIWIWVSFLIYFFACFLVLVTLKNLVSLHHKY